MRESFVRNEGKKLSYIFDLNYQIIRGLSISILVVALSNIPLIVLGVFLGISYENLHERILYLKKNNLLQIIKIQNDKQDTKMENDSVIQNEKSLEKKIEVPNKIMDPIDTENKTNDNLAYNNLHISNFLKDKNIERIKDIPSQNIDQISIKKLPNDNENVNNDGIIKWIVIK